MTPKIKKLIAREGLIILGIMLLSVFVMYISDHIYKPLNFTPLELAEFTISPQDETDAINKITDLREKYPQYNDLTNFQLSEKMAQKFPEWESVYAVMQRINKESIGKQYNYATSKPPLIKRSKLKEIVYNFGLFILFLAYPLYLLIRFIIWAVRTLMEK